MYDVHLATSSATIGVNGKDVALIWIANDDRAENDAAKKTESQTIKS